MTLSHAQDKQKLFACLERIEKPTFKTDNLVLLLKRVVQIITYIALEHSRHVGR